jgi:hypothetical protein
MALTPEQMKHKLIRLYREYSEKNPQEPFFLNVRQFKTLSGKYQLRDPYVDAVSREMAEDGYFQITIPSPDEKGGFVLCITRIDALLQNYERHQLPDDMISPYKYFEGEEDQIR